MMSNSLIIFCIVLNFIIKVHSQVDVLNSTMLKQYVFVNAPKELFRYIIKYLELTLGKGHLNLKETYVFIKIKILTITINDEKYHFLNKYEKEQTIVYPVGMVRRVRWMLYGDFKREEEVKIHFTLNEKLHLNLTFHQIYFGFRHLHSCAVGEVRVISHSKNKQVFRYCGIYSDMTNYPQNGKVSIFLTTITSTKNTIYNVTAIYSVIDLNRIVTLQKHKFLWQSLLWNLHLVPKKVRIMKFRLRTRKYQHFMIRFTCESDMIVELFDGQGTLSANIFKNNQKSHITSTFQSIIHLLIPSTDELNSECGFTFLTVFNSVSMTFKLNDSFSHTISYAFAKYVLWEIVSYDVVNVTITNLTYTGFNDPLCIFAGITVYSLNKDLYTEITTECTSVHNIFTYRDIYSKTNETLLVLYSYQEYGNLSLTMQLSTTKCKPLTINTCASSYLCKFPNNTMCRKHREQISSLNLKYSQISTDFPISVNPGQCFVFQMVAVADRLSMLGVITDCKLNFHHIDILNKRIEIHFNIKTFLDGKYEYQCHYLMALFIFFSDTR